MKTLKMICTTAFLLTALSIPAFGGEISTPGLTGQIETPGATQPGTDPSAPGTPKPDNPIPGEIGTPGLEGVLLAISVLF